MKIIKRLLVISLSLLICVPLSVGYCYAENSLDSIGHISTEPGEENCFVITGELDNWLVLNELIRRICDEDAAYDAYDNIDTIMFEESSSITDQDYSKLALIGRDINVNGVTEDRNVPAIIASSAGTILPPTKLPTQACVDGMETLDIVTSYLWDGELTYVEGEDPTSVKVKDVLDGSTVTIGADLCSATVEHADAVTYGESGGQSIELDYFYDITINHVSVVSVPGQESIYGKIKAEYYSNGKKVSGAVIGLYTDAACTMPAVDYDGDADIESSADGVAASSWLEPGTYYAKVLSVPEGCKLDKSVKKVVLAQSGKKITVAGGVSKMKVNKPDVVLTADTTSDYNDMSYADINSDANTRTIKASDYGGDYFTADGSRTLVTGNLVTLDGTIGSEIFGDASLSSTVKFGTGYAGADDIVETGDAGSWLIGAIVDYLKRPKLIHA